MKFKLILYLAFVLSLGLNFVQAEGIADFDTLLRATFPGKEFSRIGSQDFQKIPLSERNKIAVTAARELSLRTTNGLEITKETVDALIYEPMTNDTPSEAALRRLHHSNDKKTEILRDLSNNKLINDPAVIEPLINMLDYPGVKTDIRDKAAQVLCQLTQRSRQESGSLYQYVDGENNPKRTPYIAWWQDWWAKNKNRHPVFDEDVKKAIVSRVSAIQRQICLGMTQYEVGDLHPTWVEINYLKPTIVAEVEFDSSIGSRPSNSDDQFLLRIRAQFETPPFLTNRTDDFRGSKWSEGKIEQVYREELPGTDIAITVEAASTVEVFPKLVRECMSKPPQSIESRIPELIQQLEIETDSASAHAAYLLVRVGEYRPVIAALTNSNLAIQRNAIVALASFNHRAADGTGIKGAVLPLIHLLKTSDPYTRYLAAWALGHVHQEDETTVAALIVAAEDKDEQVRTSAMSSLREFKSQENVIIPAIIKKLSGTNAVIRTQACRTLGELGLSRNKELAKNVVASLIKTLEDSNNNVRSAAIWALGCYGEMAKDAFPILLKMMDSTDQDLRRQARATLMNIDFEAAKRAGVVNN